MELNLDILCELCNNRAIKWTAHVLTRLQERNINPSDIKHCLGTGRIIEQYPDDYPYPSCLLLGTTEAGEALHIVCGIGEGEVWLITAYHPDPDEWESDLKTRRAK